MASVTVNIADVASFRVVQRRWRWRWRKSLSRLELSNQVF